MKKFKISKIFKKKKKKVEGNFKKRPWDQGHWARTSQVALKKKFINQNSQFLQKHSRFPNFFQKKKNPKFSIPLKNSSFPNSKKKKKIFIKFFYRKL